MKTVKNLLLNDKTIIGLILLNAFIIFLKGFEISFRLDYALLQLDNIITVIFVFELYIKIKIEGFRNFSKSRWNIFEAILIISAFPTLLVWILNLSMLQLDFLLVFRILRIFKLFRLIRYVPNIDGLISGVKRALRASLVVLLGFFIFIFIFSMLSHQLFKEITPELFGSPLDAVYVVFQVFTVEGWNEIPIIISENSSPLTSSLVKFYFSAILLTGGILGLSIMNSIFVDAMTSDNNDELEKKIVRLESKIDALINQSAEQGRTTQASAPE